MRQKRALAAHAANNNKSARRDVPRAQRAAGRRWSSSRMRFNSTQGGSLKELGRGSASLAGKAAIGSATQGTRWVVQVQESCLREGKSERDWGKSETGGGGESIAAALVPVQCQCSASADQTPAPACRGCRRRGAGDGRPLERPPWSMLNRRSRASRGRDDGRQRADAAAVCGAW